MRILWLKTDLLLPLDKGGKLRTWHLLRHLAKRHDITYVGFSEPRQPDADLRGMRAVARHVETVPRSPVPKGSLRFYVNAARHLMDPLPYAVGAYRSREYQRRIRELLAQEEGGFDLVVCDFLCAAVNLPGRLPCPAVIFTHNVESEIWRRHADAVGSGAPGWAFIKKKLYAMQFRRMLRYEARALGRFEGVLAVSETDRLTFERLYPAVLHRPVHIIPTGVDTGFFSPAPSAPDSRRLVFTGSMDWLPNEDAMLYFVREILPIIRAGEPTVHLSIVGRAPTAAVRKLAGRAIEVTGRVGDIRPYVKDAAVYIVPLRIGGGTRLKIFEAMAMGKAVVSTTVGAEGLPVTHGRDLLVADDPPTFARNVVQLLRDLDRRRSLEVAARTLVVDRFDWSVAAFGLEQALSNVATGASRSLSGRARALFT